MNASGINGFGNSQNWMCSMERAIAKKRPTEACVCAIILLLEVHVPSVGARHFQSIRIIFKEVISIRDSNFLKIYTI